MRDDLDLDAAGLRVLGDVRQRLLHEPVDSGLEIRREPGFLGAEVDVDLDVEALGRRDAIGEALDRRLQSELVERGGAQLGDQRAQLLDLDPDLFEGHTHRPLELDRIAAPQRRVEQDLEAGEPLERLVVELTGPATTLLLSRRHAVELRLVESLAHRVPFLRRRRDRPAVQPRPSLSPNAAVPGHPGAFPFAQRGESTTSGISRPARS